MEHFHCTSLSLSTTYFSFATGFDAIRQNAESNRKGASLATGRWAIFFKRFISKDCLTSRCSNVRNGAAAYCKGIVKRNVNACKFSFYQRFHQPIGGGGPPDHRIAGHFSYCLVFHDIP